MDYSKQEADIAVLAAQMRSSSINRAAAAKEPYDGVLSMMPVAYAAFELLADACIATGHDEQAWWDFLRNALTESIAKAQEKAFDSGY